MRAAPTKGRYSRCSSWTVALLLAAGASGTAAQSLTTGVLEGVVRDMTGVPVARASVRLTHVPSGLSHTFITPRSGRFQRGLLVPGEYSVLVEQLGYHPLQLNGVIVPPGERVVISAELSAATTGAVQTMVRNLPPPASGGTVSAEWLLSPMGGWLPHDAGDLSDLTVTDSRFGPGGETAALPARYTRRVVDGIPLTPLPTGAAWAAVDAAFPVPSLSLAETMVATLDVERPATAGGLIGVQMGRAGRGRLSGTADFGSDALGGSTDGTGHTNYRIGGQASISIKPDTAAVVFGVEAWRSDEPFAAAWPTGAAAVIEAAENRYGLDLSGFGQQGSLRRERVAGYGRLDYRVSDEHQLTVRANWAELPRVDLAPNVRDASLSPSLKARQVLASATVASRFGDAYVNEFNAGLELANAERVDAPEGWLDSELVRTVIVDPGVTFGHDSGESPKVDQWKAHFRETFFVHAAQHLLKMGVSVELGQFEVNYQQGLRGEYTFADAAAFTAGRGAFRQIEGIFPANAFAIREFRIYVQDAWALAPGMELTAGVRYARLNLEDSGLLASPRWFELSGLHNPVAKRKFGWFEPQAALQWRPAGSSWVVRAGVEVEGHDFDPGALVELFGDYDIHRARVGIGIFPAYPGAPNPQAAPVTGRTLTMFGPDFHPARSTRVLGQVSGAIGPVTVQVGAVLSRTELLPRRRDLNLPEGDLGTDQHGRPIFGGLRKQGGVLVAEPGTNRRFQEMDRVWALEATGTSEYTGVTIGIEHRPIGPVGLFASYTRSSATDDWVGGGSSDPAMQLSPFPASGLGESWDESTADLDVPNRLVVGALLSLPGRVQPTISALYRRQSGYPFTAGYRNGVDANADGSGFNDPAFVDRAVAGGLIDSWSCLRENQGSFAERNGCRGPDTQALDARLSLDLAFTGMRARLVLDALNLITADGGIVDRALYLVNPATDLVVDPATGRVTVPLLPNPGFGEVLIGHEPERILRIGLRVSQ